MNLDIKDNSFCKPYGRLFVESTLVAVFVRFFAIATSQTCKLAWRRSRAFFYQSARALAVARAPVLCKPEEQNSWLFVVRAPGSTGTPAKNARFGAPVRRSVQKAAAAANLSARPRLLQADSCAEVQKLSCACWQRARNICAQTTAAAEAARIRTEREKENAANL